MSNEFIRYVKKRCAKKNVIVYFGKGESIRCDGKFVGGYFDETNKVLAVAKNNSQFLGILVHEFAHFTQWEEQCKVWVKASKEKSHLYFWKLINGEDVSNYNKHINNVRDVELDCEKRAVEIIQCHGLKINVENYIKRANAYVYSYNWIKESKRWFKRGKAPYQFKKIIEAMPSHFNNDYNKLNEDLRQLFIEQDL